MIQFTYSQIPQPLSVKSFLVGGFNPDFLGALGGLGLCCLWIIQLAQLIGHISQASTTLGIYHLTLPVRATYIPNKRRVMYIPWNCAIFFWLAKCQVPSLFHREIRFMSYHYYTFGFNKTGLMQKECRNWDQRVSLLDIFSRGEHCLWMDSCLTQKFLEKSQLLTSLFSTT